MITLLASECVLIEKYAPGKVPELVERYKRVQNLAEIAAEYSSAEPAEPQIVEAKKILNAIHSKLTRDRFRVGLMGPFQVGKSTAFNRIIGADKAQDQPSTEGGGDATTAVITRLFPTCAPERIVRAHFLSQTQVEDKIDYLKRMTNLSHVKELRELIPATEAKYHSITVGRQQERIEGDPSGMKFVKEIDVKYFGLFLKSHVSYAAKINKTEQSVDGNVEAGHKIDWEKRKEFLNHPDKFATQSYTWNSLSATVPPMLSTVDIYYPTDKLPQEIVFIDTPGLGSCGSIDEWLLDRYIPQLDGAVVIPDAMRAMDEITRSILLRLQQHFKRDGFGRRVWLVGGRADGISENWAAKTDSGFHNYRALADDHELNLNHVSFICKHPENLQRLFGEELPTELKRTELADLQNAWTELLRDGGIERLRNVMQTELAVEIGQSLADSCQKELIELEKQLRSLIAFCIEDARVDESLQSRISDVRLSLKQAIAEVRADVGEPEWFVSPTRELLKLLVTKTKPFRAQLKHISFAEAFDDHTQSLERMLQKYCRDHFNAAAYDEVKDRCLLKTDDHNNPFMIPGRIPSGLNVAWEEFKEADKSMSWRGDGFPSFVVNSPFERLASSFASPFGNEDDYMEMLETKVRLVCWQVSYIYRARLSNRLRELESYVSEYIDRSRRRLDNARVIEIQEKLAQVGN